MPVIELDETKKMYLRGILIALCMVLVVWNTYQFDVNRKHISSPEFATELYELTQQQPSNYSYDYFNEINNFEAEREYVQENAVAKCLMNLLQIVFLLFVVSILYPREVN